MRSEEMPEEAGAATSGKGRALKRVLGSSGTVIGGSVLLLMILIAVFAPWLAPHDPYAQSLTDRFLPPFWHDASHPAHPFGTDHLGRDYLSRLIYGSRVSLTIGFGVALISGVIGIAVGMTGGYFGGRIDMVVNFLITTRLSLPIVLVALAAVAVAGASQGLLIIILSLLLWDRFAVVSRAATQSLRSREFVIGARAIGLSHAAIMLREILPNLKGAIIVVATLEIANVILLEAALSFLGLGVRPPTPSWGLMIAEGRENILFDPWLIALPGAALCLLVLVVNLMGDGLRHLGGNPIR